MISTSKVILHSCRFSATNWLKALAAPWSQCQLKQKTVEESVQSWWLRPIQGNLTNLNQTGFLISSFWLPLFQVRNFPWSNWETLALLYLSKKTAVWFSWWRFLMTSFFNSTCSPMHHIASQKILRDRIHLIDRRASRQSRFAAGILPSWCTLFLIFWRNGSLVHLLPHGWLAGVTNSLAPVLIKLL